jgi:hypothetical protein
MSKILTAFKILKDSGFSGLLFAIIFKILKLKIFFNGYAQYDFHYTPLKINSVINFLSRFTLNDSDLVVVPEIYKERIKEKFNGMVISNRDVITEPNLLKYEQLFWATERVDRGAFIARHFYNNSKRVEVLKNTGPARVWMHDEVKENVLVKEFKDQNLEGIAKFGHGIGADFGNLLQFIDNAKTLDGDFVEIGCFMGSSTCVMANYIEQNKIDKKFFVYDYFDGFTFEEAKNSLDSSWMNTHKTDGRDKVEERVKSRLKEKIDNFHVFQRNIIDDDALKEVEKISFANIDVDLYEAVYAALIHVHKKLCVNGIIVVEDAGHTPWLLGAKIALEEFVDLVGKDTYHLIQMESGQYILIKR